MGNVPIIMTRMPRRPIETRQPMIRFEDVTIRRNGVAILDDFNLQIDRGEKVLIYGKSGIGKSTVLKLILGFMRPDSGTVLFEGKPIDSRQVWEVRRRSAYVSQDLDIGEGPVPGFIDGVLGLHVNRQTGADESAVVALFELLGLEPGIMDKSLQELSGGEKQRVALATVLLLGRDLLLLDEITSAIDDRLKNRVIDHLLSMEDATVIAVSHDYHWLKGDRMRVVRLGKGAGRHEMQP